VVLIYKHVDLSITTVVLAVIIACYGLGTLKREDVWTFSAWQQ